MLSAIRAVEVIPIALKCTNWDQSTVVIRISDEGGLSGIGEADGPPEVMAAYFRQETAHRWSRNLGEILVGCDPVEIAALWDDMYEGTNWQGSRGLGLFAISGVDLALHDLVGKQLGVPAFKLLGGARRDRLTPYMTLYPAAGPGDPLSVHLAEYERLMDTCKSWGVKMVKMSILTHESDEALVELITEARRVLHDDIRLAVDFLYRWREPYAALEVLRELERRDTDLYFAEAVLQNDQIAAHRLLVEKTHTRICGAEMATTRFEVRQWITEGGVAIVQPDVNRCGGLTELRRIADMAELPGVEVMPHCWKTGISAAAARHFQAASKVTSFFEHMHPDLTDAPLRTHLVGPEPVLNDGHYDLPHAPGLGIELNTGYLSELGVPRCVL